MKIKNQTLEPIISPPWYRVAMVWFIIALPLSVVIASLVTVSIAHQHAPVIVEKAVSSKEVEK